MIKVCHMTSVHAPEDVRIFKKECCSLANAGYKTYLVEQGESYEKDGVRIIGVGRPGRGRLSRMTVTARRVYKAALSVDAEIYHFHDPELLPYGKKLKKKGKKVIFDSHENTALSIKEKQYIPRILRNVLYKVYRKYEESICRTLDAVIYVTPNLANDFSRLNEDIVCLPNFPIVSDTYIPPSIESNSIAFAGLVTPTWSHANVIRAISDLSDVTYTLCGGVGNDYLNELMTLPGWGKVDYKGKVPHEQVAKILSNSIAGVALMQPHINSMGMEGTLGNTKLFEEMMAGLPIICTDFELWKPIVENNKCGICVDPNNIAEIRAAIRFVLNNKKEAIEMGKRGRKAVLEKYNWDIEEKELLLLYSRIAGKGEVDAH